MQIEKSFEVAAPPDRVYAYMTDVRKVVTCVPGAELTEVIDETTFGGRMSVRVGPMKAAYGGTARILEQDPITRSVTVEGAGKETGGSGSATATARLSVVPKDNGSVVSIGSDYQIRGRVAQFGRGIIEDVFRSVIDDMARRLEAALVAEGSDGSPAPAAAGAEREQPVKPLNGLALVMSVLGSRLRRLLRLGRRDRRSEPAVAKSADKNQEVN